MPRMEDSVCWSSDNDMGEYSPNIRKFAFDLCAWDNQTPEYSPGEYTSNHKPVDYMKGNYEPMISKHIFIIDVLSGLCYFNVYKLR